MLWWPRRGDSVGEGDTGHSSVRWAVADYSGAAPEAIASGAIVPRQCRAVEPISSDRIAAALDELDIRYIRDADGDLLAMWERHAVLFGIEGPVDEILVIRARPHATVPGDWAQRAYEAVNEWNHTRRFNKAYVGDLNDLGQLPIYAEVQWPLITGVHQAQLVEFIECAVSVSECFVSWLHDEGALL
jgi:hypothetical protein